MNDFLMPNFFLLCYFHGPFSLFLARLAGCRNGTTKLDILQTWTEMPSSKGRQSHKFTCTALTTAHAHRRKVAKSCACTFMFHSQTVMHQLWHLCFNDNSKVKRHSFDSHGMQLQTRKLSRSRSRLVTDTVTITVTFSRRYSHGNGHIWSQM